MKFFAANLLSYPDNQLHGAIFKLLKELQVSLTKENCDHLAQLLPSLTISEQVEISAYWPQVKTIEPCHQQPSFTPGQLSILIRQIQADSSASNILNQWWEYLEQYTADTTRVKLLEPLKANSSYGLAHDLSYIVLLMNWPRQCSNLAVPPEGP